MYGFFSFGTNNDFIHYIFFRSISHSAKNPCKHDDQSVTKSRLTLLRPHGL